jgi:hypothetical protein
MDTIWVILLVIGMLIYAISIIIAFRRRNSDQGRFDQRASKVLNNIYSISHPKYIERNELIYEHIPRNGIKTFTRKAYKREVKLIHSGRNLDSKIKLYQYTKLQHMMQLNQPQTPEIEQGLNEQIELLDDLIKLISSKAPELATNYAGLEDGVVKHDIKDYFTGSLSFEKFHNIVLNKLTRRNGKIVLKTLGKFIYFLSREGFVDFSVDADITTTEDLKKIMRQFLDHYDLKSAENSGQQIYKAKEDGLMPDEIRQFREWLIE